MLFLSYLPLNNVDDAPHYDISSSDCLDQSKLDNIMPKDPNKPYDMHNVISKIVDSDSFLEVHKDYAPNILVG